MVAVVAPVTAVAVAEILVVLAKGMQVEEGVDRIMVVPTRTIMCTSSGPILTVMGR